jgi:hypothetical protein
MNMPGSPPKLRVIAGAPFSILTLTAVLVVAASVSCDEPTTQPQERLPVDLVMVAGDAQEADVYATLDDPLVVRVVDEAGEGVEGIPVVWAVATEGSVEAEAPRTDAAGESRAVFTLTGLPGAHQATAAAAGLDTVTFTATAIPVPPAELTLVSGDAQEAEVGTALGAPIVVNVLDDQGRPVREAQVMWASDDGGAFSPTASSTDANGDAEAVWTLGEAAGDQTASATVGALDPLQVAAVAHAGAYESVTVLAPEIQWVTLEDLIGQGGPADANADSTDLVASPGVRVEDRYGNAVPGEPVRFTAGEGTSVNTEVVETGDDGVANAVSWTFPTEVGGYDLGTAIGADETEGPRFGVNVYEPLVLERVWGGTRGVDSCGVDAAGDLYCWNDGEWITATKLTVPGDPLVDLAVSEHEGLLGLTANGAVYELNASTASELSTPTPYDHIAAGNWFACGLAADGATYCWGDNYRGALGRDTLFVSRVDPSEAEPVEGAPPFFHIAAGGYHACGLTAEGAAYCWGLNEWGEVGDSTRSNRDEAQQVVGGRRFVSLSLGDNVSCGSTAAGEVYCWGKEWTEETDPWDAARLAPERFADDFVFEKIDVGAYHMCGMRSDGEVYCWGFNNELTGMFGDGTGGEWIRRVVPGPIAWDGPFTDVATTWWKACATSADGVVCWGQWDQLGFPYNTHPDSYLPVYVTAPDTAQ